jgi:hypothetical protein
MAARENAFYLGPSGPSWKPISMFDSSNIRCQSDCCRPIISEMISSGSPGGDVLDELAAAPVGHVVDDAGGPLLDRLDQPGDHPGRETPGSPGGGSADAWAGPC